MGYAVYHVEKGKAKATAIGYHIDRKEGHEHTYRQADPNLKKDNLNYHVPCGRHDMKLQDAINDRIKEGYKGKRAIRKDAVTHLKHVLTGSHEEMKVIGNDKKKRNEWVHAQMGFMIKEFGKENIVRAALHMDEKTPHMHFVTVPLTKDGRLTAKEVLGGRKEMSARQDRYAEQMAQFGLKRGIKRTGVKHEDAQRFYGRMKEAQRIERLGEKVIKPKRIQDGRPEFPMSVGMERPEFRVITDKKWEKYEEETVRKWERKFEDKYRESQKELTKKFNSEVSGFVYENYNAFVINDKLTKENGELKAKVKELDKKLNPEKYIKKKKKSKGMGRGRSRGINPPGWDDVFG